MVAAVATRANGRCEYCGMHQSLQGATFHVEHIVPQSRGGNSDLENLAWCCPACNLHKANRIESIDPGENVNTRLFHPRQDIWPEHFEWVDMRILGKTRIGRATIALLDLNHDRRLLIRQAETLFDLFPPK